MKATLTVKYISFRKGLNASKSKRDKVEGKDDN